MNIFPSLIRKITRYPKQSAELHLLRGSELFDANWYLANNPDVAKTKVDPLLHYYRHGGFEGRDPSTKFSSSWYLNTYEDVKKAGINPLVHYLKYGKREGRKTVSLQIGHIPSAYQCPVCENEINEFLPLSSYLEENKKKYGNPFTFDDVETINPIQYQCPICGASDRSRLYALYLIKALHTYSSKENLTLLDIAPSPPLKRFLLSFPNIKYVSADKDMSDVDITVDITDMNVIQTESFDLFICSHVLEHVEDDKKALSELFRILKPGGFGILMVPINLKIKNIDEDPNITDVGERWRRFGQYDHVRLYSKMGFIDRVKQAGFEINQYGIDYFGENAFLQHGISPKSILYVVEKS
ncbi:MAG: class I SAM-dependent methyltransferase [Anaerolineales bacterium]